MITLYSFRARKPSGSDYCRGCLMAQWDSDFELLDFEAETAVEDDSARHEIVQAIMRLKGQPLEFHEPAWEFEVFRDGRIVTEEFEQSADEQLRVARESAARVEVERVRQATIAAEQQRVVKAREAAEAEERRDRAEYERLKRKYG